MNENAIDELKMIDVGELAQLLSLSKRSIWRMLSRGQLIKPKKLGGAVRWNLGEVRQWIYDGCPDCNAE